MSRIHRPPTIMIVDAPDRDTADLARGLARAGLHVFWTAAPEVARRLSREFFFDAVLVDVDADADPRGLAEALAADGHRCLVLAAGSEAWPPLGGQYGRLITGALRRPLDSLRLAGMTELLSRTADVDRFRRHLDSI